MTPVVASQPRWDCDASAADSTKPTNGLPVGALSRRCFLSKPGRSTTARGQKSQWRLVLCPTLKLQDHLKSNDIHSLLGFEDFNLRHLQAVPGRQPLYLDCMVPLLSRLADVKYSVFAKGFHCQWHAKVVTCMAASLSYFLDPGSLADACQRKVSLAEDEGPIERTSWVLLLCQGRTRTMQSMCVPCRSLRS